MKRCKHRKAFVQNSNNSFKIICFDCMKVIELLHKIDFREDNPEIYEVLETKLRYND